MYVFLFLFFLSLLMFSFRVYRVMHLANVAILQTRLFNDPSIWPEDGSQPFVLSTGDASGFSQHGDYVFGWKADALQRAMDARCTGDACAVLDSQTTEMAMGCTVPRTVVEEVDGWIDELPGGMGGGM
jgi:hypothetical protein